MHRAHIVWLAALAGILLSDGSRSARQPVAPVALLEIERPSQTQVSSYLQHLNPDLSAGENERIAAAVVKYSQKYSLEITLVLAVIHQESSGRPWVRSSKGAVGLMQVMPHMMRPMGLAGNLATVESNIEAGCFILANNIERLGVERGISAYFWGSRIRGVAYLEKVLEARARVREMRTS